MSHDEHCGCGHTHGCDCEHDHDHIDISGEPGAFASELSDNQKDFLHQLGHMHFLPVARFTLSDSREEDFSITALAPVFIRSTGDDMDAVKEAGAFLQGLEDLGLISLDYDIPLNGYGYEEYKDSEIYRFFCKTVLEGAERPGFLGNTPVLELGSIALTDTGEHVSAELCGDDHESHE